MIKILRRTWNYMSVIVNYISHHILSLIHMHLTGVNQITNFELYFLALWHLYFLERLLLFQVWSINFRVRIIQGFNYRGMSLENFVNLCQIILKRIRRKSIYLNFLSLNFDCSCLEWDRLFCLRLNWICLNDCI